MWPSYTAKDPSWFFAKRLHAAVDNHTLSLNGFFQQAREKLGYAKNIWVRGDFERSMKSVLKAIFDNADYTLNADYLFELVIHRNVLAKKCNAIRIYHERRQNKHSSGHVRRFNCSSVDRILLLLEKMGAIVIVKENDKKYQKAARIFLTRRFFTMLSFRPEEAFDCLKKRWESMAPSTRKKHMRNYSIYQQRVQAHSNISKIKNKFKTKLTKAQEEFTEHTDSRLSPSESEKQYLAQIRNYRALATASGELSRFDGLLDAKTTELDNEPIPIEERRREILSFLEIVTPALR